MRLVYIKDVIQKHRSLFFMGETGKPMVEPIILSYYNEFNQHHENVIYHPMGSFSLRRICLIAIILVCDLFFDRWHKSHCNQVTCHCTRAQYKDSCPAIEGRHMETSFGPFFGQNPIMSGQNQIWKPASIVSYESYPSIYIIIHLYTIYLWHIICLDLLGEKWLIYPRSLDLEGWYHSSVSNTRFHRGLMGYGSKLGTDTCDSPPLESSNDNCIILHLWYHR